jgi:hypothetical protein
MAELGSLGRRGVWRNASVDDESCTNVLAARLAAGDDPQALWTQPIGRRTCEELAELDPATVCAAVCLNSEAHPCLAALVGSRALKDASKATQGTNSGVSRQIAGAIRSWACSHASEY